MNSAPTLEFIILLRCGGQHSYKKPEIIKYNKEKKDFIVEENRRNQLNAKLREMIKHLDQAEAKRNKPMPLSGTGNAIRRREGERDKRFSV
jgi:hypothetical protein